MKTGKKLIWSFNVVAAVAIVVLLCLHFRGRLTRPYIRRLNLVADAIQEYHSSHGRLPRSLSDLDDPELASFQGSAISYSNGVSEYTLSVPVPFACGPKHGAEGALPLPEKGHHVGTTLSVDYAIEE